MLIPDFLCPFLQVNKSLQNISLRDNDIEAEGAGFIADALKVLCAFSAHLCTLVTLCY